LGDIWGPAEKSTNGGDWINGVYQITVAQPRPGPPVARPRREIAVFLRAALGHSTLAAERGRIFERLIDQSIAQPSTPTP